MAAVCMTAGAIQNMRQTDGFADPVVLKVKSLQPKDDTKYKATLTDGAQDIPCVLASQLSALAKDGTLAVGSIIKLTNYTGNHVPSHGLVLMVSDVEVLGSAGEGSTDEPMTDASVAVKLGTPSNKAAPPARLSIKQEPSPAHTPVVLKQEGMSQAGPTPPSAAPPSISKRTSGFCKISALHPYEDQWKLRAKLVRKQPLRTIKLKGSDTSLMTVELVDDEGGQIQGTFWRQHAERWSQALVEGKVYVFERFMVKPANKQYSSVRNDYEITFTDKTDVSESADQEVGDVMQAAVELVAIDALPKYITRKMPVDVMGVVVVVGTAGTVKRKVDNSELARRDVTLAAKSGKTVTLTLWGDLVPLAAELEGQEHNMVLQCTACRVTDYNGCSLSSLARSQLSLNPDTPDCQQLLTWWRQEGAAVALTPIGGEAAAAKTPGAATRNTLHSIKDVTSQPVPEVEAKPVYHNVLATLVYVNPEQTMYYMANPDTGRKVVEQDGRWMEADGRVCDNPSYRYVLSFKLMDDSGDVFVNTFNEQAEQVLGISADELAALKDRSHDEYVAKCKAAQWGEWCVSVSTKSREYQGERKMRHTVVSIKPVSWVADGNKLLSLIERY